jgi:hypothetical protein
LECYNIPWGYYTKSLNALCTIVWPRLYKVRSPTSAIAVAILSMHHHLHSQWKMKR